MDSGFINLVSEIILSATEDIRFCDPCNKNYTESLLFFARNWFRKLADGINIHPSHIIKNVYATRASRANEWYNALGDQDKQKEIIRAWETHNQSVQYFAGFFRDEP